MVTMPNQSRPGTNPNEEENPQYKLYLAAVNAAEKAGTKRKLTLKWNQVSGVLPQDHTEDIQIADTRCKRTKQDTATDTTLTRPCGKALCDSETTAE